MVSLLKKMIFYFKHSVKAWFRNMPEVLFKCGFNSLSIITHYVDNIILR